MRKEIRAEMNRANAQKFTAQSLFQQPDEPEAYHRLTTALFADLKPASELERQAVRKIIDAHFRLNRLAGVENNIFNLALIDGPASTPEDDRLALITGQTRAWMERSAPFDILGRYEARLVHQVLQFTLELERLQLERRKGDFNRGVSPSGPTPVELIPEPAMHL